MFVQAIQQDPIYGAVFSLEEAEPELSLCAEEELCAICEEVMFDELGKMGSAGSSGKKYASKMALATTPAL